MGLRNALRHLPLHDRTTAPLHDTPIRRRQRLGLLGLPGVAGVSDAASQQVTQMPGTGEGGVVGR